MENNELHKRKNPATAAGRLIFVENTIALAAVVGGNNDQGNDDRCIEHVYNNRGNHIEKLREVKIDLSHPSGYQFNSGTSNRAVRCPLIPRGCSDFS